LKETPLKVVGLISACLLAVVLIVGAGLLTGGLVAGVGPLSRGHDSARPPCEQLPDKQAVVDAVASHEDLVTRIREVGPGVKVEVATPCDDQPDRAIVSITYTTDAEREGVDAILGQEGFGVAAELVSD
jgi:hypothetical protein